MFAAILSLVFSATASVAPTFDFDHPASLAINRDIVSGIDADGDTAYICINSGLRKIVLENGAIRVVDSLPAPTGRKWDRSKYVPLGGGIGILSVAYSLAPANGNSDSTIWMIDWNKPAAAGLARWKPFPGLGAVHISNNTIQGTRLSSTTAAIARSEGLFLASVEIRESSGLRDSLSLFRPKTVPVDPYWTDVSIDSTGIVAKSYGSTSLQIWNIPSSTSDPAVGFRSIVLADSAYHPIGDSLHVRGTSSMRLGADHWLELSAAAPLAVFHKATGTGAWTNESIDLPSLASDFGRKAGVEIIPTTSKIGLVLLSGDSLQSLLEWNGTDAPAQLAQLRGGYFQGTAIGTTALWQADYTLLRAYPIASTRSTSTARPQNTQRWSVAAAPGILRLKGIPGAKVEVFDAIGQRLGSFAIDASGMSNFVMAGGRPVQIRCGGIARSLFVPR